MSDTPTCPNPDCDHGMIRGTGVGCAICQSSPLVGQGYGEAWSQTSPALDFEKALDVRGRYIASLPDPVRAALDLADLGGKDD